MSRSRTLSRALAAALAVTALAAPTALARPVTDAAAKNTQDLRMPDTKDASVQTQNTQDLRMPDTKDAASPRDLRYDAGSSSLAGTTAPKPAAPASPDNDPTVPPLALVLAGVAVAGAGAGAVTVSRRRSRVAA
jgi:hypothetical protein